MKAKNKDPQAPKRVLKGVRIHYICPRCGNELALRLRRRRNECLKCGMKVDFEPLEKQWRTEWLICQNREDAIRCAEKYNESTGHDFFDPESFLNRDFPENKTWPKNMCFSFLEAKGYGRFMRWVAKDGPARLIFNVPEGGGCD